MTSGRDKSLARSNVMFKRYSIRFMLLLTAVCALFLMVMSSQARLQKRVVDRIVTLPSKTGGSVFYHHQIRLDGRLDLNAPHAGPAWLRNLVGSHYFDSIQAIYFRASEELVDDISKLRGIEVLNIDARILTDPDALCPIARMHDLEALTISHAKQLPSLNLEFLHELPNLKTLRIEGVKIDDADLKHIVAIESLQSLSIVQTFVTPKAFDTLYDLRPDLKLNYAERVISPSLWP